MFLVHNLISLRTAPTRRCEYQQAGTLLVSLLKLFSTRISLSKTPIQALPSLSEPEGTNTCQVLGAEKVSP